jgi:hypothetical protein
MSQPETTGNAIIELQHENSRLRETLQRVVWLWREDNVRSMRERGDDMANIAEGILNALWKRQRTHQSRGRPTNAAQK